MSKQVFTSFEREAIWTAYNRKCAYTGRQLEIDNFHIEHIIPESIAQNKNELDKIIRNFGLPNDFDIFGYENLLPSHPSANLTKGNKTLISTPFFINLAIEKKPIIENNIKKLQEMASRSKFIMSIKQAFERDIITEQKMNELITLFDSKPNDAFNILVELEFKNKVVFNKVSKNEINELLNMPLDTIDKLFRTKDGKKEEYVIQTCNDYFKALENGFYPFTTYDMARTTHLEQKCGLLKAIQDARLPLTSYISEPKKSILDTNLLSFNFFPWIAENSSRPIYRETYSDMIKRGEAKVISTTSHSITIEHAGLRQSLTEVMRADFDNDGIEDILLFESYHVTQGTFGYGEIRIISIKEKDGNFVIVK
ncbi:conserved hypothetical protein [Denitrovibrio acetiphilus DSM 12809]|uniref:Uncharacterized protein n=1 Tax=Denitrovibrio acetiphilus (strain DSM 12809 / NBRC 114555 / N2460) TaxID=522772 RepID=D4H5C7_DENA2|nr:HNH endonuclease domain-containing protein [Denitrovibrio acetiphilus]ADD67547.1 conserved hypothetical protein [Denitrovibrio acetiphilus DSM 12809]